MKAAVLRTPYELNIEDVPLPELKNGHVLVKIAATAICGTDVGIYQGKVKAALPRIQGHESTGQIITAGPNVNGVGPGDRVVLNSAVYCGYCPYCLRGDFNLCENGGLLGRELDGTFAEYAVVPAVNAIKIPESISYQDGTSLVALATVFRAHDKLRIAPGQSVAVLGLGPAGLLHTRLAVLRGASQVFAVTRSKWKLNIAEKFGGIPLSSQENTAETLLKHTQNQGVDVVIECIGNADTLRQAMEAVRPGGTVLLFGIAPTIANFNSYAMYYKELTLLGSRGMTPLDFVRGVKEVANGHIDLKPLITHNYELAQTKAALDFAVHHSASALRVVVNI